MPTVAKTTKTSTSSIRKAGKKSTATATKESGSDLDLLKKFQNPEDTIAKINEYDSRTNRGSKFEKIKDGVTIVRFLPGLNDEPFYYEANYHFINNETVFSRKDIDPNIACPISKYASHLWNKFKDTNDPRYEEEAKSLFAKKKYLYNAVIRGQDGEQDRVVVLETGVSVKKDLLEIINEEDGVGDITDPVRGYDVRITKTGTGLETRYKVKEVKTSSLLAGSEEDIKDAAKKIESILSQRKVLRDQVDYLSMEQIEEKLKIYQSIKNGSAIDSSPSDDYEDDEDKDERDENLERLKDLLDDGEE